jgi:hypothetical protein
MENRVTLQYVSSVGSSGTPVWNICLLWVIVKANEVCKRAKTVGMKFFRNCFANVLCNCICFSVSYNPVEKLKSNLEVVGNNVLMK